MNKLIFFVLPLSAIMAAAVLLPACKKNSAAPDYNADKTQLQTAIDSATAFYGNIQEGNKPGDYVTGSKDTLQTAIDLATQVQSGDKFTQQQVNNALANLKRIIAYVQSKLIQDVSADNLIAQWKFDGDASDATGHGHDGTLKTGLIGATAANASDGGTLPQLIADRFNRPGMAYDFNNGAYIEVPYEASLNPKSFTITLWIKRHNTSPGNYILSLNRWNGFKFQLQSNNFLFLTISTDKGIFDVDDSPGTVPEETWTYVAVSYTSGTMKFYINDKLTKTVNITGVPVALSAPVDLSIGNELPKNDYNFTDTNDPNYFWGANYFNGSIDDIRFYNTALTDAEVLSIYTIEKDL